MALEGLGHGMHKATAGVDAGESRDPQILWPQV